MEQIGTTGSPPGCQGHFALQLLHACADVMDVGWPEGRWLLRLPLQQREAEQREPEALSLFKSLQRFLYPQRTGEPLSEAVIAWLDWPVPAATNVHRH